MITSIPPYSTLPIQSLRCSCGVRFVVLVADSPGQEEAAKAEATSIGADFVDAPRLFTFECYCGAWLDVSAEAMNKVQ